MERSDWILIAAGLTEGAPLTPVQLQKSLFLIRELVPTAHEEAEFYSFEPYNYGPFCAQIYSDAEQLGSEGLLTITFSPQRRWRQYGATSAGRERARQLAADLPQEEREYIGKLLEWVRGVSFSQLIRVIYARWPAYRANSIFDG